MTMQFRAGNRPATISLARSAKASWRFLWSAAATIAVFSQAMADPLPEQAEVRYQGWAGQVTFVELADDLGYLSPLKLKWVGNTISGARRTFRPSSPAMSTSAALSTAPSSSLIAAKAPVKAVVGYYGSDAETYYGYYVKDDSPIKVARDLIGKKVAVNTLGAHLEFVLREYLARNWSQHARGQAGHAGRNPAGDRRAGSAPGIGRCHHAQRCPARQGPGARRASKAVRRHRPVRQFHRRRLCPARQIHQGQSKHLAQAGRGRFRALSRGRRPRRRKRCALASSGSSPIASGTRMRPPSNTGRARVLLRKVA